MSTPMSFLSRACLFIPTRLSSRHVEPPSSCSPFQGFSSLLKSCLCLLLL
uniref:Uncharacterized protein n=1 Tax=Arundo donax TaxID=35708 RepID=A0A0A9ET44_ARUDO